MLRPVVPLQVLLLPVPLVLLLTTMMPPSLADTYRAGPALLGPGSWTGRGHRLSCAFRCEAAAQCMGFNYQSTGVCRLFQAAVGSGSSEDSDACGYVRHVSTPSRQVPCSGDWRRHDGRCFLIQVPTGPTAPMTRDAGRFLCARKNATLATIRGSDDLAFLAGEAQPDVVAHPGDPSFSRFWVDAPYNLTAADTDGARAALSPGQGQDLEEKCLHVAAHTYDLDTADCDRVVYGYICEKAPGTD